MSRLAIHGGKPVRDVGARPWPGWPPINERRWKHHEAGFREVYRSATEGLPRPRGKRFAKRFCDYLGTSHGLLTTCGSSALKLALCAATDSDGLGYNGECIVPQYTFIATAHTALEMNFSVRFVDVDPETGCLDPDAFEAAITTPTRVVVPVDILGHPADMDRINAIARKHNLAVVEDACQAHGASYKNRKCGSLGDAGCFSFQSTKNLTSGEGGFVATDSAEIYKRIHTLHDVGKAPSGMSWDAPQLGYNYRASEYIAVLLENRLAELDAYAERRNKAARYFDHALKSIAGLRPARVADFVTNHAWHLYPMRYDPDGFGGKSRDEFLAALRAEGVPCSSGYDRPLSEHGGIVAVKNRHPALIAAEPSPNTEHIGATAVWFSQTLLTADRRDLADVPEAIHRIQKAFKA